MAEQNSNPGPDPQLWTTLAILSHLEIDAKAQAFLHHAQTFSIPWGNYWLHAGQIL